MQTQGGPDKMTETPLSCSSCSRQLWPLKIAAGTRIGGLWEVEEKGALAQDLRKKNPEIGHHRLHTPNYQGIRGNSGVALENTKCLKSVI